jgi:hypothetical protein
MCVRPSVRQVITRVRTTRPIAMEFCIATRILSFTLHQPLNEILLKFLAVMAKCRNERIRRRYRTLQVGPGFGCLGYMNETDSKNEFDFSDEPGVKSTSYMTSSGLSPGTKLRYDHEVAGRKGNS